MEWSDEREYLAAEPPNITKSPQLSSVTPCATLAHLAASRLPRKVSKSSINMSGQQPQPYSVRDIMDRYESEEDEFLRELEDMRQSLRNSETEDEIPQDPAPILTVLCSLVDEIGSLRTENRRLKTRLIPAPRAKNVVQRMSAMLENRGSGFFPRLRRSNQHVPTAAQEIRTGARDRLSTPPRKTNCMTTSSLSTDASSSRGPPLVQPELSDSEFDDNMFNDLEESTEEHRSRDTTRRCDSGSRRIDNSLSNCTSPSSASSSRDPSEAMTASRSSFLDLFGFRRRTNRSAQSLLGPPTINYSSAKSGAVKPILKKRKRRSSGNDSESSGLYVNLDSEKHRSRLPTKPPRPASYYPREESEDSDYAKSRQRKATSFLNVHSTYDNASEVSFRVDRETRLLHEKDNLMAELEELKMRNQRLVDQLREKSQQQSKLQYQLHKVEMQVDNLNRRCALSEALDRLTMDERVEKVATNGIKKIEERLRHFENQMQAAKLESASAHQMALGSTVHERSAHQACLEQMEKLQREHLRLLHNRYSDTSMDEVSLKRRLDNMPTYEALYAFTHSIVRRLTEARWALIEKTAESSRIQMDLVANQSTLLVNHAQVRDDVNFYLPLKLQGSRVENLRRSIKKINKDDLDRNIEGEFLKLFKALVDKQERQFRPNSRIEYMIREMNVNGGRTRKNTPIIRERAREPPTRRPISLVEVDDQQRRSRRSDENRRSIKYYKNNSIDYQRADDHYQPEVASMQDVSAGISPHGTPVLMRRHHPPVETRMPTYDMVPEATVVRVERVRKLERGFSTDSKTTDSLQDRDEPRKVDGERRVVRLQRSQPVSRIKQPTSTVVMRMRTIESHRESLREPAVYCTSKTLEAPSESKLPTPTSRSEKKTWLDRLKGITRT
ncbi:unnamed protein product [Caenorhabditis auriculariae]|uniref:Uncharacterized protein n=1 Tax=Caenorhabditis auriculariae TaxID=2777116 RepID=A0A8S1HF39_9PELO|nr:unnamed protein product [Caenorhabditis auriculariae]